MERRLAAVLMADVVGYSRLMEGDETGTLAALKERDINTRADLARPWRAYREGHGRWRAG